MSALSASSAWIGRPSRLSCGVRSHAFESWWRRMRSILRCWRRRRISWPEPGPRCWPGGATTAQSWKPAPMPAGGSFSFPRHCSRRVSTTPIVGPESPPTPVGPTFALVASCHRVPAIPSDVPDSRSLPTDRPPVPLLALDRAAGNELVRVGGDGTHGPVGAAVSGLAFPALSPDGRTIVSGLGQVRTLSIEGETGSDFEGFWDCGGWLGDGTSVLGRYVADDVMAFERADQPGPVLAITGGFCPKPAISPDEVVIDQGRGSEDNWVAAQRVADGSTAREFRVEGCNLTSGTASPATSTFAFAASCEDLLDSGIWVADATGTLVHVLTCVCGVPTFSPDGEWLAYVIAPVEGSGGFDTNLGFARADGTGAFHLPAGRLSFPRWAELGGRPADP